MSSEPSTDFKKYRVPQDPLLEEEEFTTESEPSFNDNDNMSEEQNTVSNEDMRLLIKAMHRLLQEKVSKPRMQIRAPDTYNGERSAAAVDGWVASLERYTDLVGSDEITKVQFAANPLEGLFILHYHDLIYGFG